MPIEVITGQPGNGKTLKMIEDLDIESKKTVAQGRRVLVACGIDGLAPGIADLELDDPKRWNEKGPDGEYLIPDGAKIYVDEAWKGFGHLHDARMAPTPPHVLALAEHRHRGLDFVMTTQMPNQLYPFMRGLIGSHTHVARKFGTKVTELFTWGELCEDVKSQSMREKALTKIWVQPKHLFDKYKSATVHTIKSRMPWRVVALPLVIVCGLALLYWAYSTLKPSSVTERLVGKEAVAEVAGGSAAATGPAVGGTGQVAMPVTAAEWATSLTPVLPGMAFTAPMFADHLEVTTHPQTLCVISGSPGADSCHCYTEQVTPLAVADALCRKITKERYYDPFKPQPEAGAMAQAPPVVPAAQAEEMATVQQSGPPVAPAGPR